MHHDSVSWFLKPNQKRTRDCPPLPPHTHTRFTMPTPRGYKCAARLLENTANLGTTFLVGGFRRGWLEKTAAIMESGADTVCVFSHNVGFCHELSPVTNSAIAAEDRSHCGLRCSQNKSFRHELFFVTNFFSSQTVPSKLKICTVHGISCTSSDQNTRQTTRGCLWVCHVTLWCRTSF